MMALKMKPHFSSGSTKTMKEKLFIGQTNDMKTDAIKNRCIDCKAKCQHLLDNCKSRQANDFAKKTGKQYCPMCGTYKPLEELKANGGICHLCESITP